MDYCKEMFLATYRQHLTGYFVIYIDYCKEMFLLTVSISSVILFLASSSFSSASGLFFSVETISRNNFTQDILRLSAVAYFQTTSAKSIQPHSESYSLILVIYDLILITVTTLNTCVKQLLAGCSVAQRHNAYTLQRVAKCVS